MASMRRALTRSNVMIVGTLVLVLGSVFYLKYMSTSSKEQKRRSIPEKRPTSEEKEPSKESETVSEDMTSATTTTGTSFEPIVLTGPPQEHEHCANEALEELWTVEKKAASDEETIVAEVVVTAEKELRIAEPIQKSQPVEAKAPKGGQPIEKDKVFKSKEIKPRELVTAIAAGKERSVGNVEPLDKKIKDHVIATIVKKDDVKPQQQQQQQQRGAGPLAEKLIDANADSVKKEPEASVHVAETTNADEDVKQRPVVAETLLVKNEEIMMNPTPVLKEPEAQAQTIVVLTEEHDRHQRQIEITEAVKEHTSDNVEETTEEEPEVQMKFVMVLTESESAHEQYQSMSEAPKETHKARDIDHLEETLEDDVAAAPAEEKVVLEQEQQEEQEHHEKHHSIEADEPKEEKPDSDSEPIDKEPEAHAEVTDGSTDADEVEKEQQQCEIQTLVQEPLPNDIKLAEEKPEAQPQFSMESAPEEEDIKQQHSETESSTSDGPSYGSASEETILEQDDASTMIPPVASSSTTSLGSSVSSKHLSDRQYPSTSSSMTLNTPTNMTHPKPTSYWEQPRIDPVSQASVGWPLLSAQEFKPQYQSNITLERSSFYTADPDNTIGGQLANAARKKNKRATRKRMTREELIQDQRQNHNASFKSRCKFWPNCSNRNCKYKHPVKDCRVGDECQFGDRCMFIHPSDIAN